MPSSETILDLLRRVRFTNDCASNRWLAAEGEESWIAEIPGEEDLWACGRTPEEALVELITILEEEFGEEDNDEGPGFSLDPGYPGPFGIPWRWILLPALLITFLLVTWVVSSDPAEAVPTPTPAPSQWTAPVVYPPAPTRDLWQEIERERRLEKLERGQDLWQEIERERRLEELERRLRELERQQR